MTRWLAILALAAGCSTHREESRQADVRATAALVAEADTRTVAERGPRTVVIEDFDVLKDERPPEEPSASGLDDSGALSPRPDPQPADSTAAPKAPAPRLVRRTTITEAPIGAAPAERVTTEAHAELAADAGVTTHTEAHLTRDSKPSLGISLWLVAGGALALVLAGAAARWAWRRYGPTG